MKKGIPANDIAEQILNKKGNLAAVGRYFGVSRAAICKRVQNSKQLQEVRDEAKESMKDNAESKLFKAIGKGEAWAICFYLKTQAKDRGYVERVENTGKDGEPMKHQVEFMERAKQYADARRLLGGGSEQSLDSEPGTNAETNGVSAE